MTNEIQRNGSFVYSLFGEGRNQCNKFSFGVMFDREVSPEEQAEIMDRIEAALKSEFEGDCSDDDGQPSEMQE